MTTKPASSYLKNTAAKKIMAALEAGQKMTTEQAGNVAGVRSTTAYQLLIKMERDMIAHVCEWEKLSYQAATVFAIGTSPLGLDKSGRQRRPAKPKFGKRKSFITGATGLHKDIRLAMQNPGLAIYFRDGEKLVNYDWQGDPRRTIVDEAAVQRVCSQYTED